MGWALARAAVLRGAEVDLVAANVALPAPPGTTVHPVVSTADLARTMGERRRRRGSGGDGRGRRPTSPRPAAATPRSRRTATAACTSTWCRPPTCSPRWCGTGRDPRQVLVGFAAETPTPDARCSSWAGRSWPARAATCWCSTRSASTRRSAATDNEIVLLTPDGPTVRTPAARTRWPTLIWDAPSGAVSPVSCPEPLGNRGRHASAGVEGITMDQDETVHLGVGDRGSPGQDRGPDQRLGPRRDARARTRRAGSRSRPWSPRDWWWWPAR